MPTWSPDTYLKALRFAAQAHQGQKVPGTEFSYVVHLCSVCMEVQTALTYEVVPNPDLAVCCALLHDTLEDTDVTFEQLEQTFGSGVAQGVQALTKDKTVPKTEQMADSLRRIKEQPKEIWWVKLADRITNLQPPPPHWNSTKITEYKAEAATILQALGSASPYLAERLRQKMEAYKGFE